MEQALSPFAAWESFYVIIGGASAALTGLQFVVIVLSAELNSRMSPAATSVFGTPTIVHFCAVLFISAVLSAPWPELGGAALALGIFGVGGLSYALIVMRRAQRQTAYVPVLEDWVFHAILPPLAYVALVVATLLLQNNHVLSLFIIGGVAVLLLFIGIHNAWDSVTYIAIEGRRQQENNEEQ